MIINWDEVATIAMGVFIGTSATAICALLLGGIISAMMD
jgi:hypothetical protein